MLAVILALEILIAILMSMFFISIGIFNSVQWVSDKIAGALINHLGYGERTE